MALEPSDRGVLTGQRPRLLHFKRGYFRERPRIFQPLQRAFGQWRARLSRRDALESAKIPVFWISGRSGDGKSVLLLQLLADALRDHQDTRVLMASPEELPAVLRGLHRRTDTTAADRALIAVDDLYEVGDRDRWHTEIAAATMRFQEPPLAIVTCGPDDQKHQFVRRCGEDFDVTTHRIASLDTEEQGEFLAWFRDRTGNAPDPSDLTTHNSLVVQFVFEMSQRQRIPEFARRFGQRLDYLGMRAAVGTILAVNALYMNAPASLLQDDVQRDALSALAADLHFILHDDAMAPGGVRLAHSHLAWLLFIEWVDGPLDLALGLARAWARELGRVLRVTLSGGRPELASEILSRLLATPRLRWSGADADERQADAHEFFVELYRNHLLDGRPATPLLARWLEIASRLGTTKLAPDPLSLAVEAMSTGSEHVTGAVAEWVWRLSETRPLPAQKALREAAGVFLLARADRPGFAAAVSHIRKSFDTEDARSLADAYLREHHRDLDAYRVFSAVLPHSGARSAHIGYAMTWLSANGDSLPAHEVARLLAEAARGRMDVTNLVSRWIEAHETEDRAGHVAATLVKTNRRNEKVITLSSRWLDAHGDARQAQLVALALLHARVLVPDTLVRVRAWLVQQQAGWTIVATKLAKLESAGTTDPAALPASSKPSSSLLARIRAGPMNEGLLRSLSARLSATRGSAREVLDALITTYPGNADVSRFVIDWVRRSAGERNFIEVIATLVSHNPANAEARAVAITYLADLAADPRILKIAVALLKSDPTDVETRDKLISALLEAKPGPEHTTALAALLKVGERAGLRQENLLDLASRYIATPDLRGREIVLVSAVDATAADPAWVNTLLSFLESPDRESARRFAFARLGAALVRHPASAARCCVACSPQWRVFAAIAYGLESKPDAARELLLLLRPQDVSQVLQAWMKNRAAAGVEDAVVDVLARAVLRGDPYRALIAAVRNSPTLRARIGARVGKEIRADIEGTTASGRAPRARRRVDPRRQG
ncbi:hypothetical protein [Sorangium cellulosum]|nr:hypothetical protein [Sorangium cellulosum]